MNQSQDLESFRRDRDRAIIWVFIPAFLLTLVAFLLTLVAGLVAVQFGLRSSKPGAYIHGDSNSLGHRELIVIYKGRTNHVILEELQ